jgi:ribosomal protein L2
MKQGADDMTKRQGRWTVVLAAGAVAGMFSLARVAKAAPAGEVTEENTATGQTRTQLVHTTATVSSINRSARTMSIKTEDGEETSIDVPKEVKQFDKLAVGDKIDLDFYRSMEISMAPSGTKPSMSERKGRMVDVGGGLRGREVSLAAEVVSVDPASNIVTFKGPKGNLRTIHVQNAANQAKLATLKPGQVVQFDWVEAVAASIRPSEK